MEHEMIPEDSEKLERLEFQYEGLSRVLRGDRVTGKTGLTEDVKMIKVQLESIESLVKQIKIGFICLIIGIIIGGVIWGVYTIKEAIGVIK